MTQVTVRRVENEWVEKAKADAKVRGVSMNTVLVEALGRGLGLDGKPRTNGLEKFAGAMAFGSEVEEKEWEKFLDEDLNEIHADDWK